jgi:hypothetical protein
MSKGTIVACVFGLTILILGSLVAFYATKYYTAPIRGKIEAREEIMSGDYRIAAYNHFFDLKVAYDSADASLTALIKARDVAISDDEIERLNASIAGVESQKERTRLQYNADAAKNYTLGQFLDLKLPYQIEKVN